MSEKHPAVPSAPTLRARELAERLRGIRLAKAMTVAEVAQALSVSVSKISRVENAQRAASARDVRDLCNLYEVTGDERDRLMDLATRANEREWYQTVGISPEYQTYVSLELAAGEILSYQSHVVTGLLQTADYARALLSTNRPSHDGLATFVETAVEVLLRRQEDVLRRHDPAVLRAVIDESALRRSIGEPAVMAAQVERLIRDQERPNVTVQVIPLTRRGGHPGLDGAFSVLRFREAQIPDTVCVEGLMGQLFLNGDNDVARYVEIFDYLSSTVAQPPDASLETLWKIHEYWKSTPT